jgi:hypothetical protein
MAATIILWLVGAADLTYTPHMAAALVVLGFFTGPGDETERRP